MAQSMSMIVSIVERGHGTEIIRLYTKNQVFLHCQRPGRGTATSEIMDILGLGSSERDVVLSYAAASASAKLMNRLNNELRGAVKTTGIVFDLPLTGLNNLVAAAIAYKTETNEKGENHMENRGENSLILVVCARGCTEAVMDTAKRAGARGGTVMKARWTGMEDLEQSYGLELQAEREIVAIVVPNTIRNQVMEAVNAEHGLKSESQSMLCSLGLDHFVRL